MTAPHFALVLPCLIASVYFTSLVHAAAAWEFERLWPRLAQPWYFNQPGAVAVAADGVVIVADSLNHRLQAFSEDGSFLRSWGAQGSAPGQLREPRALAIWGDEVFVADTRNHRVQVFDRHDGVWSRGWGERGNAPGQFNTPNGLTVDDAGRVWVADTLNHRVQVFDRDGALLGVWGEQGSGTTQLYSPQTLAVVGLGAAAEVYVLDAGNHRVQVFDTAGHHLRGWGNKGAGPGELVRPAGIVIDASGEVYISDNLNRVQVFDRDGHYLRGWGESGFAPGQLNSPQGLARNAQREVIVADSRNHRVQFYRPDGTWLRAWGSFDTTPGSFRNPYHVARAPNGRLYAADMLNHRIQVFDTQGQWLRAFGEAGSGPGQFQWPSSIAWTAQGELLVVDSGNHRIQMLSADGALLAQWGRFGKNPGEFYYPKDLAVAKDGRIYIADSGNYRIQVFDARGRFLFTWGEEGRGDGQFDAPYGVAITPDDTLWVAEPWNHRVQLFTLDGRHLRSLSGFGDAPGQFNRPHHVSADATGRVAVADSFNHRVQLFSAAGEWLGVVGEFGSQPGQFNLPTGVTLDAAGVLWVVDQNNHRIQQFRLDAPSAATYRQKAILVAGGGPRLGPRPNPIWDATELLAHRAYTALRAQGLNKTQLNYLTAGNTALDLDHNAQFDDLAPATLASLRQALTDWARDAADVTLYLIGHGGSERFQLNADETLTASNLRDWIAETERVIPGKVTVIIEACESGSFIPPLARAGRHLISSASADQPAVVSNKGLNSFSYYFWSEIGNGTPLLDAFRLARQGMSSQLIESRPQNAQLDSNGDGRFSAEDLDALGGFCLGRCANYTLASPTITEAVADILPNGNELALHLRVDRPETLQRAWVSVLPPDYHHPRSDEPVSDLPKIPLRCDTLGYCEGRYEGFNRPGDYLLHFYLLDTQHQIGAPVTQTVTQTHGPDDPLSSGEYQPTTGILDLYAVALGDQQYRIRLSRVDDGLFLLETLTRRAGAHHPVPAYFLAGEQLLTIPRLTADRVAYRAMLRYNGDALFALIALTRLDE